MKTAGKKIMKFFVTMLMFYYHHGIMVMSAVSNKTKETTIDSSQQPGLKYVVKETRFKKYAGVGINWSHTSSFTTDEFNLRNPR